MVHGYLQVTDLNSKRARLAIPDRRVKRKGARSSNGAAHRRELHGYCASYVLMYLRWIW
jgi:hypothetical protein